MDKRFTQPSVLVLVAEPIAKRRDNEHEAESQKKVKLHFFLLFKSQYLVFYLYL